MPAIAYYNGEILPFSEMKIPLSDRSIFFGDAIYDAAIGRGGKIYLKNEHIERFFKSASLAGLSPSIDARKLSAVLDEVVELSELPEYFVYFQLSATCEQRVHCRPSEARASLLVTVTPFALSPAEKCLTLITRPDRRHSYCNIKTVNLFPAVLASGEAAQSGADEAVFYRNGTVTECAHSNLFILQDGRLITHPSDENILSGISRGRLLFIAKRLGIKTKEAAFTPAELFLADEVLVSSTSKLCLLAEKIDGIPVGGKDEIRAKRLISAMRYEYFRAMAAK